ncbi:MAG: phage holin family protein [Alistipes sp.]|jgi:phage-related holin|nr:phage holin family protein [Alistipes sp.]
MIRYLWGGGASLLSLLMPVRGLVLCAVVFVAIDFATGVVASRCRARRAGAAWSFSSRRAWDTVLKLIFVMAGIVLAWLLESVVLTFVELHLAQIFTGFVCGVEFWSYLENAADISGHPVFRAVRRLLKKKMDDTISQGR